MPALVPPAVTLEAWRGTGQPTIAAGGLRLRPWAEPDVDVVVRAYTDPAIQRWHVQTRTPDEAREWIGTRAGRWAAGAGADWAVEDDQHTVLGRIAFNQLDLYEGSATLAYWVLPEARGRSVAPRALQSLTRWAFDDAGLHRLGLLHSVHNLPSCRVAEQAGYAFEGVMRRAGRHADGDHDMHLHASVISR